MLARSLFVILCLGTFPVYAQEAAPAAPTPIATPAPSSPSASSSAQPLEITAQSALEWNRDKKQYIARQAARAVQGEFSVDADTLTADYREGKDGSTEIYRLTAEGHVVIKSGTNSATGDKAVYEVDSGKAVITGTDLKLSGDNLSVTAKERLEYYSAEGKLIAVGRPLVTSGQDTLEADQVTAWLDRSAGKTAQAAGPGGDLKRAEAEGNVIIITPSEQATANRATYDAEKNLAELIGNAKVKRDQNLMEGDRAEMNLTTKVSRMFGSNDKDGRVKGVFYPAKAKKPVSPAPAAVN